MNKNNGLITFGIFIIVLVSIFLTILNYNIHQSVIADEQLKQEQFFKGCPELKSKNTNDINKVEVCKKYGEKYGNWNSTLYITGTTSGSDKCLYKGSDSEYMSRYYLIVRDVIEDDCINNSYFVK